MFVLLWCVVDCPPKWNNPHVRVSAVGIVAPGATIQGFSVTSVNCIMSTPCEPSLFVKFSRSVLIMISPGLCLNYPKNEPFSSGS